MHHCVIKRIHTRICNHPWEDALKTASAAIGNKKPFNSDIQIDGVTTSHYWPIDIAYFKTDATQATPDYQIQMDLHDNGVVTDFLIDYGDFTIHATISDGDLIENPDCSWNYTLTPAPVYHDLN